MSAALVPEERSQGADPPLGQVKVADKSNEIVAIPALLDMMAIEGAIVTIEPSAASSGIVQKIVDKKQESQLRPCLQE